MLNQQTIDHLHQMRLKGMAEAFSDQMKNADFANISFEERFGLLVDHEYIARQNRHLSRLLKNAKLPLPACMEDIDYQQPRGLDKSIIMGLSSCQWINSHQNILITGPTGVGKTFLACALANAACRKDFNVRYHKLPRLLSEMSMARGDGTYMKLLRQLAKTDLLILDEWGITHLNDTQGRDILEIIDDRSQNHSTVIASQLPLENWYSTISDPTLADAILDRIVHNAHFIPVKGESMRKVLSRKSSQAQDQALLPK
jgi:DNA replication protein DnaC